MLEMDNNESLFVSQLSGLCQCCLTENNLKLMTQPFFNQNKFEVYYEMLIKCFSDKILIRKDNDETLLLICDECIAKLRDCYLFRTQVEYAQNKLYCTVNSTHQEYSNHYTASQVPNLIKQEDSDQEISSDNCFFNGVTTHNNFNNRTNHIEQLKIDSNNISKTYKKQIPVEKQKLTLERKIKNALSKIKSSHISDNLIDEDDDESKPLVQLNENHISSDSQVLLDDKLNKLRDLRSKINKLLESSQTIDTNSALLNFVVPEPKKRRQRMSKDEFRRRCRIYFKKRRRDLKPYTIEETDNKCNVCNEEFHSYQSLVAHMNEHYPKYICDKCGKLFAVRSALRAHIRIHEEGVPCEICNKKIMKRNLSKHVNAHLGKKDVHRCPMCNERFEKFSSRALHMEKEHNIIKRYKCKWCSKVFNLAANLNLHIRDQHNLFVRMQVKTQNLSKMPRKSSFECDQCGKMFRQKLHLEHHRISKHTNEKNYQCHICLRSYFLKYTLNQHMKDYHYETSKFSCHICDKVFKVKRMVTRHIKRVHNKQMVTNQPEMEFEVKS